MMLRETLSLLSLIELLLGWLKNYSQSLLIGNGIRKGVILLDFCFWVHLLLWHEFERWVLLISGALMISLVLVVLVLARRHNCNE